MGAERVLTVADCSFYAFGTHAVSCMAGGDAVFQHDGVRDVYYDYCERGGLRPESEAPKLLRAVLGRDDRHRPADVLCVPALFLARRLPDGSRSVRTERVCLDFAVINALGQGHRADTVVAAGSTAEAYAAAKCQRNDVAAACERAGLLFCPVVHEAQGGVSREAARVAWAIASAVAAREGRRPEMVYGEMLGRIAIVLARSTALAIRKRGRAAPAVPPAWLTAVRRAHADCVGADADAMATP